jgi:ribokinase
LKWIDKVENFGNMMIKLGQTPEDSMESKIPKICVLGSLHMDLIIKTYRMPKLGETLIGNEFHMRMGGKGANQAVAAAKLGADVVLIGRVGDDYFGDKMIENAEKRGVHVEYIKKEKGTSSSVALIVVDQKGDNFLLIAPGADMTYDESDVNRAREAIKKSDILLLQLEVPLCCVNRAIKTASECGTKVIFNLSPAKKVPNEILEKVFILTINEVEAEFLTGIKVKNVNSAKKSATRLLGDGVQNVVLTLGKRGAILVSEEGVYHARGLRVKAVDTTGAGDAFCGALAVAIAKGEDLKKAVDYANFAGALATTKIGAQEALPTKKDLENFIKLYSKNIDQKLK